MSLAKSAMLVEFSTAQRTHLASDTAGKGVGRCRPSAGAVAFIRKSYTKTAGSLSLDDMLHWMGLYMDDKSRNFLTIRKRLRNYSVFAFIVSFAIMLAAKNCLFPEDRYVEKMLGNVMIFAFFLSGAAISVISRSMKCPFCHSPARISAYSFSKFPTCKRCGTKIACHSPD